MSAEPTKHGREDRHRLAEMRRPWAMVARRAGRLMARIRIGGWGGAEARAGEAHRIALMLAAVAAHEPIDADWTRG